MKGERSLTPDNGEQLNFVGFYDGAKQKKNRSNRSLHAVKGNQWTQRIFESKIAKYGTVGRRKFSAIDNYASRAELLDEVKHGGFHVVQIADQWLIICAKGKLRLIVSDNYAFVRQD